MTSAQRPARNATYDYKQEAVEGTAHLPCTAAVAVDNTVHEAQLVEHGTAEMIF